MRKVSDAVESPTVSNTGPLTEFSNPGRYDGSTDCREDVEEGNMGIFVGAVSGHNWRTGVNVNLCPALRFQAEP